MLRIITFFIFLGLFKFLPAQRYSAEISGGITGSVLNYFPSNDISPASSMKPRTGIYTGVRLKYKTRSKWDFYTGLFYIQKVVGRNGEAFLPDNDSIFHWVNSKQIARLEYLQIPLGLSYRARLFSVSAGLYTSSCLRATGISKVKDFPSDGDRIRSELDLPVYEKKITDPSNNNRICKTDWGFVLGIGKAYKKITLDVSYSHSMQSHYIKPRSLSLSVSYRLGAMNDR